MLLHKGVFLKNNTKFIEKKRYFRIILLFSIIKRLLLFKIWDYFKNVLTT